MTHVVEEGTEQRAPGIAPRLLHVDECIGDRRAPVDGDCRGGEVGACRFGRPSRHDRQRRRNRVTGAEGQQQQVDDVGEIVDDGRRGRGACAPNLTPSSGHEDGARGDHR